jgi:DNA repair protein RadC
MKVAEIKISYQSKIAKKDRVQIKSANDAEKVFRNFISEDTIELFESFAIIVLNRANEVMGVFKVSDGATAGCVVDPKIIFSVALKSMAHGIILCHNHPSGNMKASQADLDITKKLVAGGKVLEISIHDHLILSPEQGVYLSFQAEGLM